MTEAEPKQSDKKRRRWGAEKSDEKEKKNGKESTDGSKKIKVESTDASGSVKSEQVKKRTYNHTQKKKVEVMKVKQH